MSFSSPSGLRDHTRRYTRGGYIIIARDSLAILSSRTSPANPRLRLSQHLPDGPGQGPSGSDETGGRGNQHRCRQPWKHRRNRGAKIDDTRDGGPRREIAQHQGSQRRRQPDKRELDRRGHQYLPARGPHNFQQDGLAQPPATAGRDSPRQHEESSDSGCRSHAREHPRGAVDRYLKESHHLRDQNDRRPGEGLRQRGAQIARGRRPGGGGDPDRRDFTVRRRGCKR